MLKHIFNKDDIFFLENKNYRHVGEHLKKMTPNPDLQFIHKESSNFMTTAKYQSARLLPHWRQSRIFGASSELNSHGILSQHFSSVSC